jgi:hypothetical protein
MLTGVHLCAGRLRTYQFGTLRLIDKLRAWIAKDGLD